MNVEQFDDTMRLFLRREPFLPFVVELNDGRLIEIPRPHVAVNGGGATFVTPEFDWIEFECGDVRAIRPLTHETAS